MEIQRTILPELRRHLEQKEISLVIGPRQAGKTTILRALLAQLREEGHNCMYFNLDIDTDAQYFTSQHRFLERIDAQAGRKRAYIFIDEVQRIENAGLFLKGMYDRELPYKFVATGSGSLELNPLSANGFPPALGPLPTLRGDYPFLAHPNPGRGRFRN